MMNQKTVFIPCEPFKTRVFDINKDQLLEVEVNGYHVAIRELASFLQPSLLTPIPTEDGAKHGVMAVPAYDIK